ncbi:alpha/beta fold hydrolase [Chitinasiproducens palmae]|uniref:Pimeloyl-ACP methyl ester carboxylesterase n=1 Tax=Chitinasiproducens palmae TaxID=1770053 RepID=A0A1H2PKF3_9BURK|nr:alpha/beta hydrolase [Chitinasiproducens palmae]SDV46415.1 Pimeloyl-ACP methyl ester carboxylesterase [Chitinasiproducens palmae]
MTDQQANPETDCGLRVALGVGAVVGGVLLGSAVWTRWQTRRAERRHPPAGRFVDVAGGRLHYLEAGDGPPVVLIHGNSVQASDFEASGLFTLLAQRHRVIAFDRPGFGYSDRPAGRVWTPAAQADLLHQALAELGVERAVVVGHSYGATIAAAMALSYPETVRALVLLSGYYFPTPRVDALTSALAKTPLLGGLLRHTLLPVTGRLTLPLAAKRMFAPRAVAPKFEAFVPRAMMTRPVTVGGMTGDGSLMIPGAASLARSYKRITQPVTIVTGDGDHVVSAERHSHKLHKQIPHSELRVVPHAGHMVHYAAARKISAWVEALSD